VSFDFRPVLVRPGLPVSGGSERAGIAGPVSWAAGRSASPDFPLTGNGAKGRAGVQDGQTRFHVRGRVHRFATRGGAGHTGTRAERHPQGCARGRGSDLHSIYAATEQVVAAFQHELAPYEVEKEIAEREKGKAVAPK
jgi:hypothetical protein